MKMARLILDTNCFAYQNKYYNHSYTYVDDIFMTTNKIINGTNIELDKAKNKDSIV